MPWCPVCKNEYIEGKTHCPDCDVDLVDELPQETEKEPESYVPTEEELSDLAERQAAAAHMTTYTSARDRQEETRSSAWTFLLVGGVGFLVITLAIIGVIHLPLNVFALAVMEVMFVIFLVIAVISFKKAMSLLDEIASEDSLSDRVNAWGKEHLSVESLTEDLEPDTPEEMKYFIISEKIRKELMLAFPEVDDSYAEELTEQFYNELFS
jgi:hypothetical protein